MLIKFSISEEASSTNSQKGSCRRPKKVKNLEQEVEEIINQEEGENEENVNIFTKTPKSTKKTRPQDANSPMPSSQAVPNAMLQTPRRSCRKSVKPTQDYDDIVNKSCRSILKSGRKTIILEVSEEEEEQEPKPEKETKDSYEAAEKAQTKWTSAEVGRSSQKRGRKSKRKHNKSLKLDLSENEEDNRMVEHDVEEVAAKTDELEKAKTDFKAIEDIKQFDNIKQAETASEVKEFSAANENIVPLQEKEEKSEMEQVIENEALEEIKQTEVKSNEENKIIVPMEAEDNKTEKIEPKEIIKEQTTLQKNEHTMDAKPILQTELTANTTENSESIEIKEVKEMVAQVAMEVQENTVKTETIESKELIEEQITLQQHEHAVDTMPIVRAELLATTEVSEIIEIKEDEHMDKLILDESIHFIEDDSNEAHAEQHTTCKAANLEQFNEKADDSFGPYLKSNKINMEDLGLNPIKDEDDEINVVKEEMPSLILCDDEDSEAKINNETFDAQPIKEDAVDMEPLQMSVEEQKTPKPIKEDRVEMETLQMSEDEGNATPNKMQRTNEQEQKPTLLSTPPSQLLLSTPKSSNGPYRVPTPYRNRKIQLEKKENLQPEVEVKKEQENLNQPIAANIYLTEMEPKEIILRSIRKRSRSLCIDGSEKKLNRRSKRFRGPLATARARKMVSFHSPANQTVIIEDLDEIIAKSLKKLKMQKELEAGSKNKSK